MVKKILNRNKSKLATRTSQMSRSKTAIVAVGMSCIDYARVPLSFFNDPNVVKEQSLSNQQNKMFERNSMRNY